MTPLDWLFFGLAAFCLSLSIPFTKRTIVAWLTFASCWMAWCRKPGFTKRRRRWLWILTLHVADGKMPRWWNARADAKTKAFLKLSRSERPRRK